MTKQRTVNVHDAWDVTIQNLSGRFILVFESESYLIKLHLSRPWVAYIAKLLWDFIKCEERAIQSARDSLQGE